MAFCSGLMANIPFEINGVKVSGPWQWTAFELIAEECLGLFAKKSMMQNGAMAILATATGVTATLASDDTCSELFGMPAFMIRNQLVSIAVNQTAKLAGRGIRYWWQGLTENQRARIMKALKVWSPWSCYAAVCALAATVDFYERHTVEDPRTGRATFSLCSDRDMKATGDFAARFLRRRFGSSVYPKHGFHDRLVKVINNMVSLIVAANPTVAGHIPWKVCVADTPYVVQALALPHGSMWFGRDLMSNMAENVGQMSFVVAHEMAHCILRHHAEMISQEKLFNLAKLLPLTVVYACTPEWAEGVVDLVSWTVYMFAFKLPLMRSKELEADRYGQELMAASWVDHNQAFDVFAKFSEEESVVDRYLWWNYPYPLSDVRSRHLTEHKAHADQISKVNRYKNFLYFFKYIFTINAHYDLFK